MNVLRSALAAVLVGVTGAPAFAAGAITLTPSQVTVCAGGASTKSFNASHGNFTQTATSASPSVATVSPGGGTGGNVNYTVTGHATGSTTINLSDTQGATGIENVNVNGPITAPASPLSIVGTGAQSVTVNDPGPSIIVSATSSDTTVATVSATASTTSGNATFTITPVNGSKAGIVPASTTITFTDAAGCPSQTLTVKVTPGPLTTNVNSLTFGGTLAPQTFTASETDYTGLLSAASGNTALATVAPANGNGPGPVTFTVTPTGTTFGSTSVTVTDDHIGSKAVTVLVTGGTIGISGSTTATFTANDNTSARLAASTIHVTGQLQTTSSGTAQIAVSSPATVGGTHGGTLPIAALAYNCTANGSGTNQGATFPTGFLQLVSGIGPTCASFPSNQLATLDFFVRLFMDDRSAPADAYSASGFQVILTAN